MSSLRKPAARIGDEHICPAVTPGTPPIPHIGGPIIGAGCVTVLIEGLPAATTGDACVCVGEPDRIITGSAGVLIGGKPAARMGDLCMHGGKVSSGAGTVEIGGNVTRLLFAKSDKTESKRITLTPEEKYNIINDAIKRSMDLLTLKLNLLMDKDADTLSEFKKWFGFDNEQALHIIITRIRNTLRVGENLTPGNFIEQNNEDIFSDTIAEVYNRDKAYNIFITDKFWNADKEGKGSRASTIIHELSHFANVGRTKDYVYAQNCLKFAINSPEEALFNADSFAYFIEI